MLKNVAIPLMLAASEAEAQRAPTLDDIKEALEGDLRKEFEGLQAEAAACTVAASEAADNIANLAQIVADKKAQLALDEKDVSDLIAVAGAWGAADAARKDAVAAAVAQEVEADIAGKLDALDAAAEDARAKAELYVAADKLYAAGIRTQTAAVARNNAAVSRASDLLGFKTAAVNAATAARDQSTKEALWRGWRYCELGGAVAGVTLADTAKGWWQYLSGTYPATEPPTCVVPAVPAASGTGNAREAVTYYTIGPDLAGTTATGGLAAETDDGTSRWTATVVHAYATSAEAAYSTFQGADRTKAGEVAWYTGNLAQKKWTENMRKREQTFYGSANTARATALAVATSMADTVGYDVPASNPPLGLTASTAGANKALETARAARDATASGSVKAMAAGRTQSTTSGEEWKTTWAIDASSMDAWTGANASSPNASHAWWVLARDVSVATAAWWTKWHTDKAQLTSGTMTESQVSAAGPADAPCNVASGTWDTNAANSIALCKTACEDMSIGALLVQTDTTAGSGGATTTATNAGTTMATYAAAASAYCGAYSFDGSSVCKLLQGTGASVAAGTAAAGTFCAKFDNVVDFGVKQAAIQTAYALVTATLYTNMAGAADAQAALEKAWLEAWYLQQYWAAIKTELTQTTANSQAKTYYDKTVTLGGSGTSDDTTVVGAEAASNTANSSLVLATEQLATLQAATAAAAATVAALGTRIIRANTQIAELDALSNGSTGTLDVVAAKRSADHDSFASDGSTTAYPDKGEATLALEAKNAADAAVLARSGASTTDGGALTEGRALALAAWTAAQATQDAKAGELTAALGTASLVALRQTVADDTATWDAQQLILAGLEATVAGTKAELEAAEKAVDAAVLACQISAYDAYRTALEAEMEQRAADLKAIKALLETELVTPAPGTAGARCEKALSNGTYRPARGELACDEGLCCGAARVWMEAGATADAAWRTVETCQLETDTSYSYQPARAPMATTMPGKVSVDFTCIEGAKKLAAAASAVAAAVYMLA